MANKYMNSVSYKQMFGNLQKQHKINIREGYLFIFVKREMAA